MDETTKLIVAITSGLIAGLILFCLISWPALRVLLGLKKKQQSHVKGTSEGARFMGYGLLLIGLLLIIFGFLNGSISPMAWIALIWSYFILRRERKLKELVTQKELKEVAVSYKVGSFDASTVGPITREDAKKFIRKFLITIPSVLLVFPVVYYVVEVAQREGHPMWPSLLLGLGIFSIAPLLFYFMDRRVEQKADMLRARWLLRLVSLGPTLATLWLVYSFFPQGKSLAIFIFLASLFSTVAWIVYSAPTIKPKKEDFESSIKFFGGIGIAPSYEIEETKESLVRHYFKHFFLITLGLLAAFILDFILKILF